MRILVHDYSGHIFQVQLSRQLARQGHEVLHVYSRFFQTPKGSLVKTDNDSDNFSIVGIDLAEPFQKHSYIKRRAQEIQYGKLLAQKIEDFKPEWLISSNTPLDPQRIIFNKCKKLKIRKLFWLQDIYSVAIRNTLRSKIPVIGAIIGSHYVDLEKSLLKRSDKIVLISDDFVPVMDEWGIEKGKCHVIPNWAPIDELPAKSKTSEWSQKHDLADKFCLLYSGTLGLKHNPEMLLKLATHFQENQEVKIVVISEGPGRDWLEERKASLKLDNLLLLDFQPYEQLPDVLGSADILLAILDPGAAIYSVPSKTLTYLCAGRPLLMAVSRENLAAKIVAENNAGIVSPPDDINAWLDGADKLYRETELRKRMGENALNYAQKTFDIEKICKKFERVVGTDGE